MSKSDAETQLYWQIKAYGLPMPEREYRFHPVRRWRFDFAYPDELLAIEVHGGIWTGGRHVRGAGFQKDSEKYTEAAFMGWKVMHFTTGQVGTGVAVAKLDGYFATRRATGVAGENKSE